jgi:hypothetical protein
MAEDGKSTGRTARRKLLSIPAAAAATAMTVLVTWGVTKVTSSVESHVAQGKPIAWSVETNPAKIGAFGADTIALRLPAGKELAGGPGAGCSGFHPWASSQGAVDGDVTRLAVVVRGKFDGQVILSDARAHVVRREPILGGPAIQCLPAGETSFRPLSINLDSRDARARYASAQRKPFGFTLNKGEAETFIVTASATRATYSWFLDLTVLVGEEPQTVRIGDHGRPFRTTSAHGPGLWSWDYVRYWINERGGKVSVGRPLQAETEPST